MELFENMIVFTVIFLAVFFVGRRVYRNFTGEKIGCGCEPEDGCADCTAPDNNKEIVCERHND